MNRFVFGFAAVVCSIVCVANVADADEKLKGIACRSVHLAYPGPEAVAFYNDLLQALSRRGYSRRPGQTPREFAETVLRRGGEAFAPVRDVTDIFEAVRYGGGELEQGEFNRLQEALDKIREMTF